jgi:phosphoglycolate phosphatase-like HAD superfamily hydrolase
MCLASASKDFPHWTILSKDTAANAALDSMTAGRPILALDFDGVLCDSTEECVVTAWNGWLAHSGQAQSIRTPEEVPDPYRTALRTQRCYVKTGGEYYVVLQSVLEGRSISTQAEYTETLAAFRPRLKPYEACFFSARDQMRKQEESHWFDLHRVYPGIPEKLRQLFEEWEIFVVTGKDRSAVQAFFKKFQVPLDASSIFDKDAGHDKLAVLKTLAASRGRALSQLRFIDDNIQHLLPVYKAGCRGYLAGWGYHTDEHLLLASQENVPILQLSNWDLEIKNPLSHGI